MKGEGGIRAATGVVSILLAASCNTRPGGQADPPDAAIAVQEVETWRSVASAADAETLDAMALRWTAALAEARRRGFARRLAAADPLLDPSVALPRPAPVPGSYRCRLARLGARGRAAFVTTGWSLCFVGVEGDQLSLTTETASRRFGGYLWEPKAGRELIFLGGAIAAKGRQAAAYREAPASDVVGRLTRIGDFRYRLAVPGLALPHSLDVIELVAAPPS